MDDDVYKVLTPDLYRTNLFRILGLPVTAAARDVQRREARRALEAKLGLPTLAAAGGLLALSPPPGQDEIRGALARLHAPLDRFQAEFFWFWPLDEWPDPALRAVEEGRPADAAAIWGRETGPPERRVAARHNLAVFFHLSALDREQARAAEAKPRTELDALWRRALGQWAEIHADPQFWRVVSHRAAALNDAKVSPRLVARIRESLPTGLLHIHARLAFAAAEGSNSADVTRHLQLLKSARFEATARQGALRHALALWEDQIREAIDRAKTTWRAAPHRANENVRSIYDDCGRLVSIVDAVVDNVAAPLRSMEGGAFADMRNELRDMIAEAMLEGQMAYTAKVDDWGESVRLLELARQMAAGDALRVLLDENLATVRENAKSGSEWCAPGYWDLPDATIATLEEARALTMASDFEGAMTLLSALPSSIDRPLRRAASFCLTAWSAQIFNVAIREFRQEPTMRRRLIDRFAADRSPLHRFPDPELPDFMKPPCPSCGNQAYRRWSQFKVRDIPVWLCRDCADTLDVEIEGKRNVFRRELAAALECQLLADELYPDDPRTRLNLGILEQHARDLQCALPGTASLMTRFHHTERFIAVTLPASPEDAVCHYCGEAPPSSDCAIQLPMCGDIERERRLFGESTMIRTAMIVVPRCLRCRDAHRDLGGRRVQWRDRREQVTQAAVSRFERKARIVAGLTGVSTWAGAAYGLQSIAGAGVALAVVVGLLAGAGAGAAMITGSKRRAEGGTEAAMQRFVAETPDPSLPSAIKAEEAYLDFHTVRELRQKGWSFGHTYALERPASREATGLVSAVP
ncbi:hypothetical protein [Reyranella sp.]|uniref:hypothetical protein n=1 Tax=Reyranella sp. TaxID=1929291 RepID=UPI003784673F